jgi:hypothetical protein
VLAFAGQATAATLVVDAPNPVLECPDADFPTINAAVLAAAPGDKIKVCPGLYNEGVVVPQTLTLQGARRNDPVRTCEQAATADPTRESIVNHATTGFLVNASDVRIEGFTVQLNPLMTPFGGLGIITSPTHSGYDIEKNVVQSNFQGMLFESSGAHHSRVRHNCFRDNNVSILGLGTGIGSSLSLKNAIVAHNAFVRHGRAGLVLYRALATSVLEDVSVSQNISIAEGAFIEIYNSVGSEVVQNDVLNGVLMPNTEAAIFVGGGNIGLSVEQNRLENGAANGIVFRFASIGFVSGPSTDLSVRHNEIRGFAMSGIEVTFNSLASSLLAHNRSTENDEDGLKVNATGNAGNLVAHNQLRGNALHDCHDATTGSGTAGTANTWDENKGETQNRPGLCKGATVTPPFDH